MVLVVAGPSFLFFDPPTISANTRSWYEERFATANRSFSFLNVVIVMGLELDKDKTLHKLGASDHVVEDNHCCRPLSLGHHSDFQT